jgi:hypothetical protein
MLGLAQGNDVIGRLGNLPKMPLGDRCFSLSHSVKKNTDGHNELKLAHRDTHLAVPDLVFWHPVHEDRQSNCKHTRLTPSPRAAAVKGLSLTQINTDISSHFETINVSAPAQTPAGLVGDAAAACCPDSTVASPSRDPFVMGSPIQRAYSDIFGFRHEPR